MNADSQDMTKVACGENELEWSFEVLAPAGEDRFAPFSWLNADCDFLNELTLTDNID